MGKKSSSTTSKTVYGNTTTTNPYVTSQTNNKGTATAFNKGSAFDTINKFVNNNMSSMLEQYLNPTLNSVTNQAKLKSYINTLNSETAKSLENNIINPLSKRNMVRSSQATDLYNNLSNQNVASIGNYANDLLANTQADMSSVLTTLMLMYMNGYGAITDAQKQSLTTSQGNAKSTQSNTQSGMSVSDVNQLAMQMALLAANL